MIILKLIHPQSHTFFEGVISINQKKSFFSEKNDNIKGKIERITKKTSQNGDLLEKIFIAKNTLYKI